MQPPCSSQRPSHPDQHRYGSDHPPAIRFRSQEARSPAEPEPVAAAASKSKEPTTDQPPQTEQPPQSEQPPQPEQSPSPPPLPSRPSWTPLRRLDALPPLVNTQPSWIHHHPLPAVAESAIAADTDAVRMTANNSAIPTTKEETKEAPTTTPTSMCLCLFGRPFWARPTLKKTLCPLMFVPLFVLLLLCVCLLYCHIS